MWRKKVTFFRASEEDSLDNKELKKEINNILEKKDSILEESSSHDDEEMIKNLNIETRRDLNLDNIEPGSIKKFWIALAENGLGLPIKVPVIAIKVFLLFI